ncbi:MAG: hypothetical protein Kow0022_15630 [Phycisphaerales bacterium]
MAESCSDRDVLIGRVIDGEASAADWQCLRAMAEQDPRIWDELEQTQALHRHLCAGVNDACSAASNVDVPGVHAEQIISARIARIGAWGGWLAAAALLLSWAVGLPPAGKRHVAAGSVGPSLGPEYVRIETPEDALQVYVDRGRDAGSVVGLVADPRIVQTRALPDGSGLEVLLVREILERRLVNQVYRLGTDDAGNVRPVPVQITPVSDRVF